MTNKIDFKLNRRLAINICKGVGLSLLLYGLWHYKIVTYHDLVISILFHEVFYFIPYFIFVFFVFFLCGNNFFGRLVTLLTKPFFMILIIAIYIVLMLLPPLGMKIESQLFVWTNLLFLAISVSLTGLFSKKSDDIENASS